MTGHPQSPVERWIGSHSPAAQELANRLARPHLGLGRTRSAGGVLAVGARRSCEGLGRSGVAMRL